MKIIKLKNKSLKKYLITFIVSVLNFLFAVLVLAQSNNNSNSGQSSYQLQNPITINSINDLLVRLVEIVIRLGSIVVVLFIIWAGLKYILAQGKPEEIKKAHKMFGYTVVGALILLGAQVIVSIITNTVNHL